MADDPLRNDPVDRDESEADLSRRSAAPALSPWLAVGGVLLLGAVVYVASALLA